MADRPAAAAGEAGNAPAALGLVLCEEPQDIAAFVRAARARGLVPLLYRPTYEIEPPPLIEGVRLMSPMDHLRPEQVDAIYAGLLAWQRSVPAIRLGDGNALEDWRAEAEHPRNIWMWLHGLVPHVHAAMRLVAGLEALLALRGDVVCHALVGNAPATAWMRVALRRAMAVHGPHSGEVSVVERASGPVLAPPVADPGPPPAAATGPALPGLAAIAAGRRCITARERALAYLQTVENDFADRARGRFAGHAVLVMRGARGTQWLRSAASDAWLLVDEYAEQMPEALIASCRASGWRLTIVYLGAPPQFDRLRTGYSERYPSFVSEITFSNVGGIASAMRPAVHKQYAAAVRRLMEEPAFRAAFRFAGVDFLDILGDYLNRALTNLATLLVTQTPAWSLLFERLRPSVVFGGRLETMPYVTLAAHHQGAKAISIKLGVGEEMLPAMVAIRADGRYDVEQYPDMYAVWGERQRQFLRERLPEFRGALEVSGRARNDTFALEAAALDPVVLRARMGLRSRDRVVVFGASFRTRYAAWPGQSWGAVCLSAASYRAALAALTSLARELGDTAVIVKPHPADDIDHIRGLVAEIGGDEIRILTRDDRFHNVEILAVADVLVSTVSSMFSEAAILGRVSVNLWLPEVNFLYERNRWLTYNHLAVGVEDLAAMRAVVRRLLTDAPYYESVLRRVVGDLSLFFGAFDGRNADRCAALGMALAEEGSLAPARSA